MILPSLLKFLSSKRVILASSSPRRKFILDNIGLKIEVIPSTFEENIPREAYPLISDYAIATAREKAFEVHARLKGSGGEVPELIIAADTIVAMDGEMFGKPLNGSSAREMLLKLGGRSHEVYTGVVLLWGDVAEKEGNEAHVVDTFYQMTKVKMASLTEEIISAYIETGEPLDKAGSYGIQGFGGTLIEGIEGDYFNIVGLPLFRFCQFLSNHYTEKQTEKETGRERE